MTFDLAQEVHTLFIKNGWTLSLAESCTGGTAAARLTQIPGASKFFLGSFVCYSNEMKGAMLQVPKALIRERGAVSQEAAFLLAENAQKISGSDFSLAVTGIAGPDGGTPDKPVGTIWCAVCKKGEKPETWKLSLSGTRQQIISSCVDSLFTHLLEKGRL